MRVVGVSGQWSVVSGQWSVVGGGDIVWRMSVWWSIALCAIFLIGVTKSGFGSGVGLMIVPMMAIAATNIQSLGAAATLGVLLPLLIAGDILAAYQYRHLFSFEIVRK